MTGPALIVLPVDNNTGLYFRGPGVDDELFADSTSTFEVDTSAGRRLAFQFDPHRPIWARHVDNVVGVWSCSYYRPAPSDRAVLLARLMPGERIESVRNTTHA
ncbi:endonuclease [Mycobacterium phage Aminay]|uniref:Uncharacterized protein n=1 Tax=Mycobacterium phage Aminay TaxID=2250291 RepID=A0A345KV39_9CAUD|nr:endonuclease [Mycobacterium phage Aminay]AXH46891.1 hypothetical protein SEA_AMINAY_53 [Mycobacterium phage Aminay]